MSLSFFFSSLCLHSWRTDFSVSILIVTYCWFKDVWLAAVTQRRSTEKVFLEISQNSQENTWARVSFLLKFTGLRRATLLKVRLWHRRFLMNFVKFLRTPSGDCFCRVLFVEIRKTIKWVRRTQKPHLITSWNHSL